MTEPITVTEALKALRMAKEVDGHAEAGPWARPDDVFDPEDADAIVMWRDCFSGMVDGLILGIEAYHGPDEAIKPDGYWYYTVSPVVAWARTREKWSKS